MLGPETHSTTPPDDARDRETAAKQPASAGQQLSQMAELVADGELPLPERLAAEQLAELAREVQKRRRRRLIRFIAQAIAMDIARHRGPEQGGSLC